MTGGRLVILAAAALTGTVANVPMTISENVELSVRKTEARRIYASLRGRFSDHKKGPGWTVAQVKRMARKSRNKARNKAAHKGKK